MPSEESMLPVLLDAIFEAAPTHSVALWHIISPPVMGYEF